MTTILGIETSGLDGSVALLRDGVLVGERRLAAPGRRHAQTLLAEVHGLLQAAALTPRQIDAVAVSLGPGSFTGLRVGVVCAKTWAYATGCAVLGIDTFATCAALAPADWQHVWVIGDAQRGDFFACEYRRDAERAWQATCAVTIVPGDTWLAERTSAERIIGPGVARVSEGATAALVVRDEWATRPTATTVARLGASPLQAGRTANVWTLAPIYIRPSAAEEKRASS